MAGQHLSLTALTVLLTVSGALFYGAFRLYSRWSEGRPESIRRQRLHPVTHPDLAAHASEEEEQDGSNRG